VGGAHGLGEVAGEPGDRAVQRAQPAGDSEEKILEAAENCPMSAIIVEDAETGEQLFP